MMLRTVVIGPDGQHVLADIPEDDWDRIELDRRKRASERADFELWRKGRPGSWRLGFPYRKGPTP